MTRKTVKRVAKQTIKQQYATRLKSLQRQLRRYEKRGFHLDLELMLTGKSGLKLDPTKARKKDLERIKALKPKQILEKYGFYVSEVTYGEMVSAKEGFKFEREWKKRYKDPRTRYYESSDRPHAGEGVAWTDMLARAYILDYYSTVDKYKSGVLFKKRVEELIEQIMLEKDAGETDEERRSYAESKVAEMLDNGAKDGLIVNYEVAYSEAKMLNYWTQMVTFLNLSPMEMDRINEAIEYGEIFRDYDNGDF